METREQVFERRRLAVQRAMAENDLSALVLFGQSSYAGSAAAGHGNIRYLTDWTGRFAPSVLIMPAEGLPTVVAPSGHDKMFLDEAFPWVGTALIEWPANYGKLVRKLIGKPKGAVGLVGQGDFPLAFYRGLVEGNDDVVFKDATDVVESLRITKDEFELARHRQAAQISDLMYKRLLEVLPGFTGQTWQLMGEMEATGRKAGAELAACWIVTGQPADRPRYRFEENEREVKRGDEILIGTYVTYRGYWGHCLRMGSLGKPSETYQQIYDATLRQHREAAALIQVGEDAAKVQSHADELANTLIEGGGSHPMRSRHGHFMGLDYAEKPTGAAFPQPQNWSQYPIPVPAGVKFRPGMVLETHTMLGQDGKGFGFLGDVYLATEKGPERLTQFPQELFVV